MKRFDCETYQPHDTGIKWQLRSKAGNHDVDIFILKKEKKIKATRNARKSSWQQQTTVTTIITTSNNMMAIRAAESAASGSAAAHFDFFPNYRAKVGGKIRYFPRRMMWFVHSILLFVDPLSLLLSDFFHNFLLFFQFSYFFISYTIFLYVLF